MSGAKGGVQRSALEDQLRSELEHSRIIRGSNRAKVAGPESCADAALLFVPDELSMVPDVKALGAELETAAPRFADEEALEQRQVPVVATRTTDCVMTKITPGSERRSRKYRRVKPFVNFFRIGDRPVNIWPVGAITVGAAENTADIVAAQRDVERGPSFHRDDA